MSKAKFSLLLGISIFFLTSLITPLVYADVPGITLPPSFHINVYAEPVPGARFMALGDQEIVYVGTLNNKVYALLPQKNATSARVITLLKGLNGPNGVTIYKGDLYVAEINRILRYPKISQHLMHPLEPIVVTRKLPDKKWHGYRVLHISPDGWLYASVGMPCNTCDYRVSNPIFGAIIRMRLDGSQLQIYAKGIRNSMGFDWQPQSHLLWFTDNGQDYLGDNLPPDEIDCAPNVGLDFGFPYVYGNNVPAPRYEKSHVATQFFVMPAYNLPAHVAPLGLTFYTGAIFPVQYRQQMFIAEHGSWNRSKKIGYQVIVASVQGKTITNVVPFASGWLNINTQTVTGRPVDVLTMPDGSILVSDDFANKVYRITYDRDQVNRKSVNAS